MARPEVTGKAKSLPDQLIPDAVIMAEFSICTQTLIRWDQDPQLGFPPPIKIRRRKFRSRNAIEEFKRQMMQRALDARLGRPRKQAGVAS